MYGMLLRLLNDPTLIRNSNKICLQSQDKTQTAILYTIGTQKSKPKGQNKVCHTVTDDN